MRLSECCWWPPTDDSESVCSRCHEHAGFEEESHVDRPDTDSQPGPGAGRRPAGVPAGVTTIHDVDRAMDALTEACDRYTARKGARA
jgi:hypothetical protein